MKAEMERLAFGNDISRIVRGIAIILMVIGHSLPGKVIGFAVPLFSFLVGYGYAFAKERSAKHSLRRIWHLLSNYWLVIFALCLPAALLTYPKPIHTGEVLLGLFGLNPRLNFFAWYVYFYIFAMTMMPLVSRAIDRFSWKGLAFVLLICGLVVWGVTMIPRYQKIIYWNVTFRCFRYLPVVATGYFIASRNLVSQIRVPRHWIIPLIATSGMAGIYFVRGLPWVQMFDFLWAPAFAFLTGSVFLYYRLTPIRYSLTQMGLKSMHIWFLHALFFTHATKGVFGKLTAWVHWKPGFILMVIVSSFIMAILVEWVMKMLHKLFEIDYRRLGQRIISRE